MMSRIPYSSSEPIFMGRPIELQFLGWRSNTATLQKHGWQFAIRDYSGHNFLDLERHIDMRMRHSDHPEMGGSMKFRVPISPYYGNWGTIVETTIGLPYVIEYNQADTHALNFTPVDVNPRLVHGDRVNIADEPYFKPIKNGKEIFIEEASVKDILDIALSKQEKFQGEIRNRIRKEEERRQYLSGGSTAATIIGV